MSSPVTSLPWSPPPPRGSTPKARRNRRSELVSPAPAGIDPTPSRRWPSWRRLPRPRGDRPQTTQPCQIKLTSPPPPRGSTRWRPTSIARPMVSPAPAGIDPRCTTTGSPAICLPRPRGDRPAETIKSLEGYESPPPPRGSTPARNPDTANPAVSPAPAGIDPTTWTSSRGWRCLPRPRGDRPLYDAVVTGIVSSPPPPRGSTPPAHPDEHRVQVSPAPAGIDPDSGELPGHGRRLPRPRGDRPWSSCSALTLSGSPPPPRGSTRNQ